jgi:GDP-4-dehydro-6-deoxy-D-mannose reductase
LDAEELVNTFAFETGISTAIARIFNVVGPGQSDLYFASRVAGQVAAILAGKAAPIIRTGPLSSTRDFLDIRDVCFALDAVLERSFAGTSNVASGVETKVGDLLQQFLQTSGLQGTVKVQEETGQVISVLRHFANISRLTATGFAPKHSLVQTCTDMLTYYQGLICL